MYLSGLGAGPFLRTFIFVPPGSNAFGPYASVCGTLPNGCYNTGRVDMGAPVGGACLSPDPQQFADFQSMAAYAASHGETLREFSTVQEINAFCSTAGIQPVQVAAKPPGGLPSYAPPTIQQIPAPGYVNPSYTPGGTPILSTGVATASAPQMPPPGQVIVSQPSGPIDFGSEPGLQEPTPTTAGPSPFLLLLLAGVGVSLLAKRRP